MIDIDLFRFRDIVVVASFWTLSRAFYVGLEINWTALGLWNHLYLGFIAIGLEFQVDFDQRIKMRRSSHKKTKKRTALSFLGLDRLFHKLQRK
jgi:hypothetical protein